MMKFAVFSNLILLMTVKVSPNDGVKENELCVWWKSVKLDDKLKKEGGFITKNGIKYSENETFMSDNKRQGCPCINNPCIRKCCKENEVYMMKKNNEFDCNRYGINVIKEVINNEIMKNFSIKNTSVMYHDLQYSCYRRKMDFVNEDYRELSNGSLLYKKDNHLVTIDNYCFDYVQVRGDLKSNITNGTYFFMCSKPEEVDGSEIQPHPSEIKQSDEEKLLIEYQKNLQLVYYPLFMVISLPFLTITFVIYTFVSELNNLVGKCVASMTLTIAVSYNVMFPVMRLGPDVLGKFCKTFGYLTEFTILSSLLWLNVMCFDIWAVFSERVVPHRLLIKEDEIKKYLKYAIYAWGSPLIVCGIIYFVDEIADLKANDMFKPNMGNSYCLLSDNYSKLIFYYFPLTIILILNITFFTITLRNITNHKSQSDFLKKHGNTNTKIEKERFNLYLKLFLVMGISWIGEPLSRLFNSVHLFWLWFVVDAINLLQGITIFIIFVCKRRTFRVLNAKLQPSIKYFSSTRTSRSSTRTFRSSTRTFRKESNVDSPEIQESTVCLNTIYLC